MRGVVRISFALSSAIFSTACGAGTAAVAAGTGGSGGGSSPALISDFKITETKEAPALIEFRLSNGRARVELLYHFHAPPPAPPDDPDVPLGFSPLEDISNSEDEPVSFPATLSPGLHQFKWDFSAQLGIPRIDTRPSYQVYAHIVETPLAPAPPTNSSPHGQKLGNDLTRIASVTVRLGNQPEVSGDVLIDGTIEDTPGDKANIKIEFRRLESEIWGVARPTETGESEPTPLFGLIAEEAGGTASFSWDSKFDLGEATTDVLVRLTPFEDVDGVLREGASVVSQVFRVDNNGEPILQIDSGSIIANPDEHRGIPIPFRVVDVESDDAEVILQWRRPNEEFLTIDLDGDGVLTNDELDTILEDPAQRAGFHVCTPFPHYARGLAVEGKDDSSVRLPELAREMSWIFPSGLERRTLELLRPPSIPAPITSETRTDLFEQPVAALPFGSGENALVLESTGGSWQLRAVELATGRVLPDAPGKAPLVVLGAGFPSAMCFERGEEAVLVASDLSGTWQIQRVPVDLAELTAESPTPLFTFAGVPPELVHGIASLGRSAVLLTAGTSLFHLDYRATPARLGTLLTNLDSPWGLAIDLLDPVHVYVSESGANRILSVEIDAHAKLPVVVNMENAFAVELDHPAALALERGASRLLIVTGAPARGYEVVGLELGARSGNAPFTVTPPMQEPVTSLASGPDGLRLLAVRDRNEVWISGGVEQHHTIVTYEKETQVATVDVAFDPDVSPGKIWRIAAESGEGQRGLNSSAQGERATFLWNSGVDLPDGGSVYFRGLARDDEIGVTAEGFAPKFVRSSLNVEPLGLGGSGITVSPRMTAIGDLDGDGDLDIVSANQGRRPRQGLPIEGDCLTIFLQDPPGVFPVAPSFVLGGGSTTPSVQFVALGDLNGDGRLDIVSANRNRIRNPAGEEVGGGNLTIFFQRPSGVFPTEPSLTLGGLGSFRKLQHRTLSNRGVEQEDRERPLTQGPTSVAIGDLNDDGLLDIVSANEGESAGDDRKYDNLTIFLQDPLLDSRFRPQPSQSIEAPLESRRPQSVAIGDIDGDGRLDIVSANEGLEIDDVQMFCNVTIYLQDPHGGFPDAPSHTLGDNMITEGPEFVAIGDIDGDGAQDVVSVNENSDDLRIFFQDSCCNFTESKKLGGSPDTVGPESVALGDLDGDGDLDLATTNEDGTNLALFYQVADRVFSPASKVGGPFITDDPHGVALSDLDGDGDLDLVSANDEGNDLTIFFQRTARDFEDAALAIGGVPTTNQAACIALGDLDGDGDRDVVSGNRDGDNLTIFVQEPTGNFTLGAILGDEDTTNFPHSVALGDLDGDGFSDLVSANKDSSKLTVFFQGEQGLREDPLELGGSETLNPRSVAIGDLDGDGAQDLVSANEGSDNLTIFFQAEDPGSFPDIQPTSGLLTGAAPYAVAIGDLDLDGNLELVSANRGGAVPETGSNLSIFVQEGPRTFVLARTIGGLSTTLKPRSVAIGDLDSDGIPDIVSANEGGDDLTIFFQDATGGFESRTLVLRSSAVDAPFSVALGDLDGDGDQDLVSANEGSDYLTAFFQDLPGRFGPAPKVFGGPPMTVPTTTATPWSVAIGDLDDDGDQDIASANRGHDLPGFDSRDSNLTIFWGGR